MLGLRQSSTARPACWAGVDVGATRKGFHAAAVDDHGRCVGPVNLGTPAAVRDWLRPLAPLVVALDSPLATAPQGRSARDGELRLARSVCGIRWTPHAERLAGNAYYAWILHGLELAELLRCSGSWEVIEVFPTASWTRWAGPRRGSRARWSQAALDSLGLSGAPARLSQDGRDAIAAAVTAQQWSAGATESFEEIVVPTSRPAWS
jgi:predicted nuclease with RNAse H fold